MQDIILFMQHHAVLTTLFAIALALLFILELIKSQRNSNQLTPMQATQLINHNKAIIVDVRSHDAFLTGHIVGAMSLPFNEIKNKIKKVEKFKSQPIIVVCAMGQEANRAAALFKQESFQTHILAGGIRAWNQANMPLVKG